MNPLTLREVLDATGAILLQGDPNQIITGVSTDSRTLDQGAIFLALSGPNFDGNLFVSAAAAAGAAALLLRAEHKEELEPGLLGSVDDRTAVLIHPDPRRALADLAGWVRSTLPATIVAITGSSGKTTTKDMLHGLLSPLQSVVASPASYNNDIGVPLTLLMASKKTETLALEIGSNNPGEIAGLCRIAKPDAGVITNIGTAHLEGLGSVDGVAREKGDLAASLSRNGFLVLNADCRFTKTIAARTAARVITFSIEATPGEEGDLDARKLYFHSGGTTFTLNGHEVTMPLLGTHNVQNLLAALAVCLGLGLTLEEVLPGVAQLHGSRQRMERVVLDGVTIFDDSYNANPDAARAAVRVLAGVHGHKRRVLVLGDMLELGDLAAELHHRVGREAAEAGIDRIVLVGELARAAAAGALEGGLSHQAVTHVPTTEEALSLVEELVQEGDVVLVKGSRRMRLERIVKHLQMVREEV
ncbi:MAG: UDP-N-acetylmuramoyl-tripeptide--D-alanyl-D-alanine ligase [Planctomycetota bacterium]